jgi:hypothetical protein
MIISTSLGGLILKYLLSFILLTATIGTCIGQTYYTISVPYGWNVYGAGCNGIAATDSANPARGIIALNHIHTGFLMLPSNTNPETYVEYYLPQDFSRGNNQVMNMRILSYENDQSTANAYTSSGWPLTSAKSMRCSFEINGIPAEGSFLVGTREIYGQGTTVDLLFGIYAPQDQFETEAPMLLGAVNSIRLIREYFCLCYSCKGECDYRCTDGCCNHPCNEVTDRCS